MKTKQTQIEPQNKRKVSKGMNSSDLRTISPVLQTRVKIPDSEHEYRKVTKAPIARMVNPKALSELREKIGVILG